MGREQESYVHLNFLGSARKLGGLLWLRGINLERLLVIVVDGVVGLAFTHQEG